MNEIANSALAHKVPELAAFIVLVMVVLGALGFLFRYVVNKFGTTIGELESRHEGNEGKMLDTLQKLTETSHTFHREIMEKTHKVVMDNTVQMARNTDILERVMEKMA